MCGGASQDDDDDFDVTWFGSSGEADDIDPAGGETPKTEGSYGGSIGGGDNIKAAAEAAEAEAEAEAAAAVATTVPAAFPPIRVPLSCPRGKRAGCRAGTRLRYSRFGRQAGTRVVPRNLRRALCTPFWLA